MTEIKRYSPDFMFDLEMVVCGDGEFVAYEDHAAIVAALQEQVRALEHEKYNLTQYKAAYVEWQDKTEWVQGDKRFDVLLPWGKHRADVLKDYVERVEGQLKDEIARRDMAAVVPPPLDNWHNSASGVMQSLQFKGDELSFTVGANWMRQQCLELGAQPQKVVEVHKRKSTEVISGQRYSYVLLDDLLPELDAARVKWEVKK